MQTVKSRLSSENRRAEIVKVALQLSAVRSPGDITTSDIAHVMGLTQGAVFRHFSSKEGIWLAVAEWIDKTLLSSIEAAVEENPGARQGLTAAFRTHVKFVLENPGVPRVIFHELQHPDDTQVKVRIRTMLQNYRNLVICLLQEAKNSGVASSDLNEGAAAALFIGAIQGLVMQSMLAGSVNAIQSLSEGVLAIYLDSLESCK